jgi:hypothetical protein
MQRDAHYTKKTGALVVLKGWQARLSIDDNLTYKMSLLQMEDRSEQRKDLISWFGGSKVQITILEYVNWCTESTHVTSTVQRLRVSHDKIQIWNNNRTHIPWDFPNRTLALVKGDCHKRASTAAK